MKISVVIPNYNGEKLLQESLPRMIAVLDTYGKKSKTDVEIIINDDGSTDNSRQLLDRLEKEKKRGRVHFVTLANGKNYGFSTTVNRGVRKASGEIVILFNTDVLPEDGCIEPLLKHFSDEKVFAVGCMDKSVEGDSIVLRGRGVGEWKRGLLEHRPGNLSKNNTLWVSGGSGAFRKSIWDELEGLNELMNPFYWEDIDLSYRALKSGYKLVFEKESTVIHKHEEGAIKKMTTPKRVRVTAYRNQFIFTWTNMSDLSLIFTHLFFLPFHIIRAIVNKDASLLEGLIKAILLIPAILKKRKSVQKKRKVSDSDVIKSIR